MSSLSSHYPELSAKEIQQTVAEQLLIYEKRKAQLVEKASQIQSPFNVILSNCSATLITAKLNREEFIKIQHHFIPTPDAERFALISQKSPCSSFWLDDFFGRFLDKIFKITKDPYMITRWFQGNIEMQESYSFGSPRQVSQTQVIDPRNSTKIVYAVKNINYQALGFVYYNNLWMTSYLKSFLLTHEKMQRLNNK